MTTDNQIDTILATAVIEWRESAVLLTCTFGPLGYSLAALGSVLANSTGTIGDDKRMGVAGTLDMLSQVALSLTQREKIPPADDVRSGLRDLAMQFITTQVGAAEILQAGITAENRGAALEIIRCAPSIRARRCRRAGTLARMLMADIMRGDHPDYAGTAVMLGMALAEISDEHESDCEGCPDCNEDMALGMDVAIGVCVSAYRALNESATNDAEAWAVNAGALHSDRWVMERFETERRRIRLNTIEQAVGACMVPLLQGLSLSEVQDLVAVLRLKRTDGDVFTLMFSDKQ